MYFSEQGNADDDATLITIFLVSFKDLQSCCLMQSAVCNLQSAVCSLQSAVCSMQSAVCSLQSAVCGLRSAACSLQMSYTASPMEVSCLKSSYRFCNAQLFMNPNPKPETAFFQKEDKPQPHVLLTPIWICAFLHAYSSHPASHPHPVSGHLLFDSFENVYYFLLHISWCQLQ